MSKKDSGKKIPFTVIILILAILAFGGFFIYTKMSGSLEETVSENDTEESVHINVEPGQGY